MQKYAGNRFAAEQRVRNVAEQPQYGLIRRVLFFLAAITAAFFAWAGWDVFSNPAVADGAKAVAFAMMAGCGVVTVRLLSMSMTGK